MKFIGKLNCPANLKEGEASYSPERNYFIATRYGYEQRVFKTMDKVVRWCNGEEMESDEVVRPDLAEMEHYLKYGTTKVFDFPHYRYEDPLIYDDPIPKVNIKHLEG
jgi:hypothetical protein